MYCLNCGTPLADTAKFCHVCGAAVRRAETPTTPPTAPGTVAPSAAASPRVSRGLLGCGAAVLGVLVVVGLALAAAYFALGLHRTSGITDLAPLDAAAVVTIRPSLLQLPHLRDTDRLTASAAAFAPLVIVPGLPEFAFELAADYGAYFEQLDIDPAADIVPWIGRDLGIAVVDADADEIVASLAVRSEAGAAAFLAQLQEQLEDEGLNFDEAQHSGVTISEVVEPVYLMPVAMAVTDNRLLLASSREALEDALDRAGNDRDVLATNGTFREAVTTQPDNRLGYVYINPESLGAGAELDALRWIAGAYALTSSGVRFGYRLGFDRDQIDSQLQEQLQQGGADNRLAHRLPEDTLVYLAGQSLIETLESAAAESAEAEDFLEEFRDNRSLRSFYDLLQLLTGEYAAALVRDDEGLLAESLGEPYGMVIAAQVADGNDALAELDDIFDDLARDTDSRHETDEVGRATVGYLDNAFAGGRFLGYGVDGREMILGTSEALVEGALEAENTLADSPRFRSTIDALPSGGLLYVYLDSSYLIDWLSGLIGLDERSTDDYADRIEAIGLAIEPLSRAGEMNAELFFLTEAPPR